MPIFAFDLSAAAALVPEPLTEEGVVRASGQGGWGIASLDWGRGSLCFIRDSSSLVNVLQW